MRLAELNSLEEDEFVALLGAVFEHSPWVAVRTWSERPFASLEHLHVAMMQSVGRAKTEEQLALMRKHPELAGREALEGALTADSSGEQGRLGFTSLSRKELEEIAQLNRGYRQKFGFPCIVALRLHQSRESVTGEMRRRLENDPAAELRAALEQIGHITHGRLAKILGESDG